MAAHGPSPYQSASLYVGDLHPTVTEALLFEIFKVAGPVASIRVCRDAVTRRSLGYAYVNYHNVVDAERALESLNYTKIKGKSCRIMWSHRDPSVRKSGEGNIFIKNLDKSIDNKALYDTFSTFGNILSCKVVTDGKGVSKGYGFIHYETKEAGEQAIEKVNDMMLNGKIVYVGPFIPRKERIPGSDPEKFTNLYIKNLDPNISEEQLREAFADYAPIQSCVIAKDESDQSKGFGFLNFENPEDAKRAVEEMNLKKISDREIYVARAQKKIERESFLKKLREERAQKYQGKNLYIKNLEDSVNEEKLREAFAAYGTISSCRVMRDEKGTSRGFGFVCFDNQDEASKAVTEMNGSMLAGKPIYVALAERKELRRAKLEAQHAARAVARMAVNPPNMTTHAQIYPGQPVFYPPPQAQRQGAFVYPQVPVGRRWPTPNPQGAQGRQGFQHMPNYIVPAMAQQQRNPRQNQRQNPGQTQGQQQQGGPGFKYTPNARNASQPVNGQEGGQMPQQGIPSDVPQSGNVEQDILGASLAAASHEERKEIIGNRLYPLIETVQPTQGPKITGMLLDSMPVTELLHLLQSPEALNEKIEEALAVLEDHQQQNTQAETLEAES